MRREHQKRNHVEEFVEYPDIFYIQFLFFVMYFTGLILQNLSEPRLPASGTICGYVLLQRRPFKVCTCGVLAVKR